MESFFLQKYVTIFQTVDCAVKPERHNFDTVVGLLPSSTFLRVSTIRHLYLKTVRFTKSRKNHVTNPLKS